MKITAELKRIRQEWNPDTGEELNSVVFAFAGVTVEVPISEQQVKALIAETRKAQSQADIGYLDTALDVEESSAEVFGGDYTDEGSQRSKLHEEATPVLQKDSVVQPQEDQERIAATKAAMRARAHNRPVGRIFQTQTDQAGNPIVPQRNVVAPREAAEASGDEDGFAQG